MTTNDTFGQTLSTWLHEEAEHAMPDHLGEILVRTVATSQRKWWSSPERWLPMDLTTRATAIASPRLGRLLLAAVLIAALLAVTLFAIGSRRQQPAPFGPAANGSIVYSTGGDILLSEPDGSAPRVLVGGSTTDVGPTHSHDGTRFAFLRQVSDHGFEYVAVDADGSDPEVLTTEPLLDPDEWDWSPDDSSLVVLHTVDGKRVLSIVPTDGSGAVRRLDLGGIAPTNAPAWRPPDGPEIVFRGATDDGASIALYGIRPDGTGLHQLTPEVSSKDAFGSPRLSPDGNLVAYWGFVVDGSSDPMGAHPHVLDLRSGADHLVGDTPTGAFEVSPKFSPDGKHVLYIRYAKDVPARLMLAPTAGPGVARQVGPDLDPDANIYFEFSPDGQKILVADRKASSSQVVDVDDGHVDVGAPIDDWATWQRVALTAD